MIYFVRLDSGAVKIGTTDNLKLRLEQLRFYFASKTFLLGTLEGDRQTEQEIHERFAHLRFGKSEQFKPGPELLAFIGYVTLDVADHELIQAQPVSGAFVPARQIRFTDADMARIEELGHIWGPIIPLRASDVIRECVRRVHKQEIGEPHDGQD